MKSSVLLFFLFCFIYSCQAEDYAPPYSILPREVAATPTPYSEVVRVVGLLPKPEVGFVDFGCGSDARWCIAAAEKWGCKATGVEINAERAAAAKKAVALAGLGQLVTIVEGDAELVDVKADVGVAYLYADTLEKLKPRLEKLKAFSSYLHQPPGLPVVKNGDSWLYTKPVKSSVAVWNGQAYSHPVCNDPNCGMCNSIRSQLAVQRSPTMTIGTIGQPSSVSKGHYETRKICYGRGNCQFVNVWVPD